MPEESKLQNVASQQSERGRNPALVRDEDGREWMIFYAAGGSQGQILAKNIQDQDQMAISDQGIDCAAVCAGGSVVVWNQLVDGIYQLFARDTGGGNIVQLTEGPAPAICPAMDVDADETVWLTYQTASPDGTSHIYLKRRIDGRWTDAVRTSDVPGNNWCPDIACLEDGRVAVGWDGYAAGSYDIYLRFLDPDGTGGQTRRLTADECFQAHLSLAPAPEGSVWVAWNSGTDDWGKDNEVYRSVRIPDRDFLHVRRQLRMRRVFPGEVRPVYPPVQEVLDVKLPGLLQERPHLRSDDAGFPWLGFRYNVGELSGGHRNDKRWQAMVTRYEGDGWSDPVELAGAHGLSTGGLSLLPRRDGSVLAAAAGEGQSGGEKQLETSCHLYRLEEAREHREIWDPPVTAPSFSPPATLNNPSRHQIEHDGELYNLYFGDVHRHTELSFCRTSIDGSPEEAYRQTRDAGAMDFAMTADHDHQEQAPDMWSVTMQNADRFNVPGHFSTFFGYEWIGGDDNRRHRNIVSCMRPPVPPFDYGDNGHRDVRNLWQTLEPGRAITIPHHTACSMSLIWGADPGEAADPEMEPLVEIFQASRASSEYPGCPTLCSSFYWRGKSEGFNVEGGFVSDALAQDIRMGFISSSDHMSTHRSYACVYAAENTRQSLMEAMKARRTYAATDRIICDFRMGEAMMGEELAADGDLPTRIHFAGTGPIKSVALLRDSRPWRKWEPAGDETEIELTIPLEEASGHYFYARMIQEDSNMAWASPIWVE